MVLISTLALRFQAVHLCFERPNFITEGVLSRAMRRIRELDCPRNATAAAIGCFAIFVSCGPIAAEEGVFAVVEDIRTPAGPGAREPSLYSLNDGRVAMIWTEPSPDGHSVELAIGDEGAWETRGRVVESGDLFVNWADFSSIAVLGDGTVVAHWLRESTAVSYAYDVNLALSRDGGRTWSAPITPHGDGTASQHGFVSLLPVDKEKLAVIWLDGRAYGSARPLPTAQEVPDAMQLRAAFLDSDGELTAETVLDLQTCTCCQTSATVAEHDTVLVAYRDRTADEIRDISIVRFREGRWSDPLTVHADGWEISGCPVNGPAIDAVGTSVAVAWFTAARDIPIVNVAFSTDGGLSFDAPFRVDGGKVAGRVDVLMLEDGSALVSWVEWTEEGEKLQLCQATPEDGCGPPETITVNSAPGSMNFPRMVLSGDAVFIAWSQPGAAGAPDSIRLVKAYLSAP